MKALFTVPFIGFGILGFASEPVTPQPPLPAIHQGEGESGWTFAGYIDVYYQFDFGRPARGNNVNGRGFDIAHDRIRMASAEIGFSRAPNATSPWGFNLQLYGGKNSELIHLAEPGGSDKYHFIRQAYVTYAEPKSGWTFDLGKYDTWIGYEGIDTRSSDQYGRGFNWTYSEPTYETGFRATGKLSPSATLALFLVRGWNEVEDGNNSASMGAQLTYTVNPKMTVVLQNHFGNEGSDSPNDVGSFGGIGFPMAGTSRVHLFDAIVTYQWTDKTKLAFNFDYGTASGGPNTGKWNGEVLYARHQINDKQAASLRLERVEDSDGLRAGVPVMLHSVTLGYDWLVCKNSTLRFELRRDFANQAFFADKNGAANNRTTFTAAAIVKF